MLRNFFILAWRNFRHNPFFSAINIFGQAVGISASLIVFLIVHYDFSFDRFEKNRSRVFRVVSDMHFPYHEFKGIGERNSLYHTLS